MTQNRKPIVIWDFIVVLWLGLYDPSARAWVQSLVMELGRTYHS